MRTDRRGRPGAAPDRRPKPHLPNHDLLYGRNAVAEALRGRRRLRRLTVSAATDDGRLRTLIAAAEARAIPVERVPREELDIRLGDVNHQGVALLAGPFPYAELDDLIAEPRTILVLDHLQDPQNFGTLLRSADAAGAHGVVIPQDRAVAVSPAVVNASAGAVEHLRVARVPNLPRALDRFKAAGWWSIALDTGDDAVDLFTAPLPTPAVLVVGAEGGGIGTLLRRKCDVVAAIPMSGQVASLNAATAGSIALFELVRRARVSP